VNRTAAEYFVDSLVARGVRSIAALCGHGLDPLFFSARRAGIRIVDVRNEQTAGYIADYYGRLTGTPGVCASSSGVAVANALTGVMNAWFDHSPMVYISGTAASPTLGLGAFQDSPHVALAQPVTKLSMAIDHPARVLQILDLAWETAAALPCGPVHLELPMDVQTASVDQADLVQPPAQSLAPVTHTPAYLQRIAHALLSAQRPLIIAGSEVYYAREGDDLLQFAERYSIPIQTPIWDRGVIDSPNNLFAGVIGAASGGPALLEEADCVLLAAVSDYRVGYLQKAANLHRITRGWRTLSEYAAGIGVPQSRNWATRARQLRDDYTAEIASRADAQRVPGRIHSADIARALADTLPLDASLIIDGGSIGQWAHQFLCHRRYPSHWLTCGRSGVVGYGLAAGMAARLVSPDRPVVLLSGDGAFTFTVAEIECAVRQNLPFVAIVADDQCWGITHSGHLKQFGEGVATQLGRIDFALLAQSLGARGQRINTVDELVPAIRQALDSRELTLLHVPTSGGNPH